MDDRFAALGYRVHLVEDEGVWVAMRAALAQIDDLRRQLDDVRGRRPWRH